MISLIQGLDVCRPAEEAKTPVAIQLPPAHSFSYVFIFLFLQGSRIEKRTQDFLTKEKDKEERERPKATNDTRGKPLILTDIH